MDAISNRHRDWEKYYKQFLQEVSTGKKLTSDERTWKVNVGPVRDETGEITNLRYFLPLAAALAERGSVSVKEPLTLSIHTTPEASITTDIGADKDDEDDIGRVQALLPVCSAMPYVQIKVNNSAVRPKPWVASRIFPVCCVSGDSAGGFPRYSVLRKNFYSEKLGRNAVDLGDEGGSFVFYANALLDYIDDSSKYVGSRDSNIRKDEAHDKVMEELKAWLPSMDLLSQIIWTYMLRVLIGQKELFSLVPGEKAELREHVLIKSRMDAAFYAESIYQLVENACVHSEEKRAWFGLRMHYTNRMAGINEFARVASTRERLTSKYAFCFEKEKSIFSENHNFYMEFYVLNRADTQRGITPTYNSQSEEYNRKLDENYVNAHEAALLKELRSEVEMEVREEMGREADSDAALQNMTEDQWEDTVRKRVEKRITRNRLIKYAREKLTQLTKPDEHTEYRLYRKPIEHFSYFFQEEDPGKEPGSKEEIFREWHENDVKDLAIHYGMRLLHRIVVANDGYLIGWSPNGVADAQYYHIGKEGQAYTSAIYTTELCAIIPVTGKLPTSVFAQESDGAIYGETVEPPRKQIVYLNCDDVCGGGDGALTKPEDEIFQGTVRAFKFIWEKLRHNWDEFAETVFQIELTADDTGRLERFSKGLFGLLSLMRYKRMNGEAIYHPRIAILFQDSNQMGEFVRLFSIFFTRRHDYLDQTQLALCTPRTDDKLTYCINLVLNGSNLNHIRANARLFAYYDTKEALIFLPLLAYFERLEYTGIEQAPLMPVFPFDLYLRRHGVQTPDKPVAIQPWKDSWFIDRTKSVLNTDIQSGELGCAIRDIQFRLGSKLHFDRFYEAELLFHNTGNMMRFAFLLTQELLYGESRLGEGEQILLIGYAGYSVSLLLQMEKWLVQSGRFKQVRVAIVSDDMEKEGMVHVTPFFSEKEAVLANDTRLVTVLPIGTTLSTIYKMYNAVGKKWKNLRESRDLPEHNYCLILINHDLLQASGQLSEVSLRFWKNWSPDSGTVEANEEVRGGPTLKAKFMIAADGEWHAPDRCEMCGDTGASIRPVIDVKKSDTVLASIFPLQQERSLFPSFFLRNKSAHSMEENRKRLIRLFGYISYSHICKENNHFQFYIDFEGFYQKNRKGIEKAIRGWNTDLDPRDMHVIVSPLQVDNSQFAKAVIDYQFSNAVGYLHFDLTDTYREEARAKFSNIITDFQYMKRANPKARLNFYFVDTSIVTASRLHRAETLVRMLALQAGLQEENLVVFKKIYLLINRCSFDTINTFVENPSRDLLAYIHLDIPSYNTENGKCPACHLVDKYDLLEKRSSTKSLSREFCRLQLKHEKREWDNHGAVVGKSILTSHSYFARLVQWMYINTLNEGNEVVIRSVVPGVEFPKEDKALAQEISGKLTQYCAAHTKNLDTATLAGLIEEIADRDEGEQKKKQRALEKKLLDFVQRHILQIHDYMRFYALERAYEKLDEAAPTKPVSPERLYKQTRAHILDLFDKSLRSLERLRLATNAETEEQRFMVVSNVEWTISYVKVISREQLSNYYYVRQAIMGIMSDMIKLFDVLLEPEGRPEMPENPRHGFPEALKEEHNGWKKIVDTIQHCVSAPLSRQNEQLYAAVSYELYMTLTHRMADLHSYELVRAENIRTFVDVYVTLKRRYDGDRNTDVCSVGRIPSLFPPKRDVLLRYLKAIKSATMMSNDDTPCLSLTELPELISANGKPADEDRQLADDLLKEIASQVYVENTRMMFSGMRELDKAIQKSVSSDDKAFLDRIGNDFVNRMEKLDRYVVQQLGNCYSQLDGAAKPDKILYQNVLGNFCRFWHSSTGASPVSGAPADKVQPLTYILQYFRLLDKLSSETAEERKLDDPQGQLEEDGGGWRLDDLPYFYEEICRAICGFTCTEMCYMACQIRDDAPEIFIQSGYHSGFMSSGHILANNDIETITCVVRGNWVEQWTLQELIPGVSRLTTKTDKFNGCDFVVLSIPIRDDKDESSFYIILQRERAGKDDLSDKGVLQISRDILYLRQRLQKILSRDYTILTNFRFDPSYIRPINGTMADRPVILHLSDLHITTGLKDEEPDPFPAVVKELEKQVPQKKVDLLAITGDIVDGRSSNAPQMEDNYKYAEQLLNQIVTYLWRDKDGYLPHDWKRRIVITTGNHDYAAMNQFKAQLAGRVLTVGVPVRAESGTMAKFAYYIDFLIRYLDRPIHKLLADDLNEVRNYRNLKLKILVLNCSSRATPRRTNKMGVNNEKVAELLVRSSWMADSDPEKRSLYICMAHYAPGNELSYLLDNYDWMPGWNWSTRDTEKITEYNAINYFVARFLDAASGELCYPEEMRTKASMEKGIEEMRDKLEHVRAAERKVEYRLELNRLETEAAYLGTRIAEQEQRRKSFIEAFEALATARSDLRATRDTPRDNASKAPSDYFYRRLKAVAEENVRSGKNYHQCITKLLLQLKDNDLFRQIESYYTWLHGDRCPNDEHISALIYEVAECVKMSQYDKMCFERIIRGCKRLDLYLAGHIHAYMEADWQIEADEPKTKILVADKMFKVPMKGISGYIIEDCYVENGKSQLKHTRLY